MNSPHSCLAGCLVGASLLVGSQAIAQPLAPPALAPPPLFEPAMWLDPAAQFPFGHAEGFQWTFAWPHDPLAIPQPLGHQVIRTQPNGYIYRPIWHPADAAADPADAAEDPFQPVVDASAATLYGQAVSSFQLGHYETALDQLDALSALAPDGGWSELLRAHVLLALGDYRPAALALQRALPSLPRDEWGHFVINRRDYYPSARRYAEHLAALEDYARANPDLREGHLLLAYHYLHLGRRLDAVRHLELAIESPVAASPIEPLFDRLLPRAAPLNSDHPLAPPRGREF